MIDYYTVYYVLTHIKFFMDFIFLTNTIVLKIKLPHQIEIKIPLAPNFGAKMIDNIIIVRFLIRLILKIYFFQTYFLIRICWLPKKGKLDIIMHNIKIMKL